jgi:hypothetical protein
MGMYLFALIMIILNVAAFGADLISTELRTYQPANRGKALINKRETSIHLGARSLLRECPFVLDHRNHRC